MQDKIRYTLTIGLPLAVALLSIFVAYMAIQTKRVQGSVSVTDEYIATSTAANVVYGAFNRDTLVKTGQGVFGSLVITGANTGVLNFYDATTTNVNARTGQTPTSTILMASIPASATAGTYTFDVLFKHGLLMDLVSGEMPTTTLTYRNN